MVKMSPLEGVNVTTGHAIETSHPTELGLELIRHRELSQRREVLRLLDISAAEALDPTLCAGRAFTHAELELTE